MLAFGSLLNSHTLKTATNTRTATPMQRNFDFNLRAYSTVSEAESSAEHTAKRNVQAQMLHDNAVRKEMGPIAAARKVNRTKGNYKFLAGIAVLFGAIYYYSVWKVGQDDFSDVDAEGNIREKV